MNLIPHTHPIVAPGAMDGSTRSQLVQILRHRVNSLKYATPSLAVRTKRTKAEQLLKRFEHIVKADESAVLRIVKEESLELMYLYSEKSRFRIERSHLLSIVYKAQTA